MIQFRALYSLILRTQATRARLILLGALGLLGVLIAIPLRNADDPLEAGAHFIDGFGLSLVAPITTLVFASAALGDFIDDGTMVYLWLRPVPRFKLALAAAAASLTVVLPLVVVPLTIAAAVSGGADLIAATIASVTVGVVAYTAMFVMLGIRVKRALLWGLLYILVWEGFVTRIGDTSKRLGIGAYTRSILNSAAGLDLEAFPTVPRYLVPLAVTVASLAYATRRLTVQDVA